MTRAPCRRRTGVVVPRAEDFGGFDNSRSQSPQRGRWFSKQSPIRSRGTRSSHSMASVSNQNFSADRKELTKVFRTVGKAESHLHWQFIGISWNHCTSTFHRSKTNGIAERAVRREKEGTSAVLLQSGLDEKWWADSMECYCYLRNVQDLLGDGKTHYDRRFGEPFTGPVIPFKAMVECHPISAKDKSRLHQFGRTTFPGIFLGIASIAGNLERRYFGRRHWGAGKFERVTPLWGGNNLQGVKISEENFQANRKSVNRQIQKMTLKPKKDFWSIHGDFIYRHHTEPRVQLCVPKEETFPCPLKHIDVTRATETNVDMLQEKRIDLLGIWTRIEVYQTHGKDSQNSLYWEKNHSRDICGPVRDWQRFK